VDDVLRVGSIQRIGPERLNLSVLGLFALVAANPEVLSVKEPCPPAQSQLEMRLPDWLDTT
jgi:hypothetical protein